MSTYKALIEGKRYKSKRFGDAIGVKIENVKIGDRLDMGVFVAREEPGRGQGPNTWNIRLEDGFCHTETRGAVVRVYVR